MQGAPPGSGSGSNLNLNSVDHCSVRTSGASSMTSQVVPGRDSVAAMAAYQMNGYMPNGYPSMMHPHDPHAAAVAYQQHASFAVAAAAGNGSLYSRYDMPSHHHHHSGSMSPYMNGGSSYSMAAAMTSPYSPMSGSVGGASASSMLHSAGGPPSVKSEPPGTPVSSSSSSSSSSTGGNGNGSNGGGGNGAGKRAEFQGDLRQMISMYLPPNEVLASDPSAQSRLQQQMQGHYVTAADAMTASSVPPLTHIY